MALLTSLSMALSSSWWTELCGLAMRCSDLVLLGACVDAGSAGVSATRSTVAQPPASRQVTIKSVLCVAFMKKAIGVVKMCLERVAVMPVTVAQRGHSMKRITSARYRSAYADRLTGAGQYFSLDA